ncbi:MAG: hypothetical protein NC548_48310, partial [Lachnospiraceae bacterium]|nr:hypothetical protein [Lachnospiraceae bacterium]
IIGLQNSKTGDKARDYYNKKLKHFNDIENLHHKTDSGMNITIDGANGRLYSIMTRMKSEYRHGGFFTINGERFKEVDISNSQPTLLGLRVKRKKQELGNTLNSLWMEHALKGDFYEWLIDITGLLKDRSVDDIISEYNNHISKNKKSKKKKVREQALDEENVLDKVKHESSSNPYIKLRPLIKHWIIKFLFGKQMVGVDDKQPKNIERKFLKNLWRYLYENEPSIYEEILWYKKHPEPKRKHPDENASVLARRLQDEEVRYIKEVLKNLDPHIRYLYTVHDCIGCLESDVELVKSVMEQTALDIYGVKLKLKVE